MVPTAVILSEDVPMAMVSRMDVAEGRPSSDLIQARIAAIGLKTGLGAVVRLNGREADDALDAIVVSPALVITTLLFAVVTEAAAVDACGLHKPLAGPAPRLQSLTQPVVAVF